MNTSSLKLQLVMSTLVYVCMYIMLMYVTYESHIRLVYEYGMQVELVYILDICLFLTCTPCMWWTYRDIRVNIKTRISNIEKDLYMQEVRNKWRERFEKENPSFFKE